VRKSSASPPARGLPHQPSSSSSDTHAAHGASPIQKDTPGELDHPAYLQVTRDRTAGPNDLPSLRLGMIDIPRRVSGEDYDSGEGSADRAKLVAPSSEKEVAWLEHERIADLERQLSETLAAQTERDRRITQLSALPERAEASAAEEKKRSGLELRNLQAKLDESLLSRDHALEQAQSALQKASCAAEANERSQRELTEMRAELEVSKSELAAFRLRPADTENGCAKSKAEANTNRTQTATGLVNMDEERVVQTLMERMRTMEAEIASLRWNEKSFETMECRNEE
jgi:hypothetical protein